MSDINQATAIVGPVRLSYLNVFEPKTDSLSGKTEYSVTLLIPKEATEQCPEPEAVGSKITAAIKAGLAAKFTGTIPAKWHTPLKDGDTDLDGDGEPRYPGYWFLKAACSTDYPPLLIDGKKNRVSKNSGWKAGDWGLVKIICFGYDRPEKKGVTVKFAAIQFLYEDEGFGGGGTSIDEFEEVADAAGPVGEAGVHDPFDE